MIETFKDAAVEIKEDEDGKIEVKTNITEQEKIDGKSERNFTFSSIKNNVLKLKSFQC